MPRAFFGTFFRVERKYDPPSGRQPHHPRRSRRVNPSARKRFCTCGRTKGLSSGQTIGAVRTAVRSACCLPELRVANRLRRLYPLDTRFPSVPFGNLRAPKVGKKPKGLSPSLSRTNIRFLKRTKGGFPRSAPHCRELRCQRFNCHAVQNPSPTGCAPALKPRFSPSPRPRTCPAPSPPQTRPAHRPRRRSPAIRCHNAGARSSA